MLYDLIPIFIIIVGIIFIFAIIIRKFPVLAAIDVKQIPIERQKEIKQALVEERLMKKLKILKEKMKIFTVPAKNIFKIIWKQIKFKMKIIEERYLEKQRNLIKNRPLLTQQKIQLLLSEGEELIKKENLAAAEKKYIEIIKLDQQNILAYRNLGGIYLRQKDYSHAEEILNYAMKLCIQFLADNLIPEDEARKNMVFIYRDMGLLCKSRGECEQALESFRKVVDLEPNSPKNLDLLIEAGIITGNKDIASEALGRLKEVNPDNQKIAVFEEQIKTLAS